MVESDIKIGDVAHDLVKKGKVQVIDKAADSVEAYREEEQFDLAGYQSHPLLDVGEDEPVFTCVYLPDEPTVNFSGTYDFPASRLARVPVEEANADYERVQHELIETLLIGMLLAAHDWTGQKMAGETAQLAADAGVPADIVDRAEEVAEATVGPSASELDDRADEVLEKAGVDTGGDSA